MIVRAVDGGGAGFRRAEIEGTKISNFKKTEGSLKNLDELLSFVEEDLPTDAEGIAYAMAGVISADNIVVRSPNVHWLDGVYLAKETERRTGLKTFVFNDMEAAVTGMATLFPNEPRFLGVTWSSGIGLRVWDKDQIFSVCEGGHIIIDTSPFALLCGCGKRGHAEAIVGGRAIRRRAITEAEARGISIPEGLEPCNFLDNDYIKGEEWAVGLYQVIAQGMGVFLANIQTLLHLPLIVWKGTVALKALRFLEPLIRQEMKQVMIEPVWAEESVLRFIFSPNPDHDSLIGAAACFQRRLPE